MIIQNITSVSSVVISIISLIISLFAFFVSRRNASASEKKVRVEIEKWRDERNRDTKNTRLQFLRDISNSITYHNWRFIDCWDFPGVFPPLADMKTAIPDKSEVNRELFGQRVITLSHFNILLQVFAHRNDLKEIDIEGYTQWANNWYKDSKEAMRIILKTGDVYPLDFIIWLRDVIFHDQEESMNYLIGEELKGRLRIYEKSIVNYMNGEIYD